MTTTMTRQDFQLIADTIASFDHDYIRTTCLSCDADQNELIRRLAEHFASRLRYTNPNFDRDKFIKAATSD